jgi:hypothetical protein
VRSASDKRKYARYVATAQPAGTNPRCVTPSSDPFGTILNESIDLHLYTYMYMYI